MLLELIVFNHISHIDNLFLRTNIYCASLLGHIKMTNKALDIDCCHQVNFESNKFFISILGHECGKTYELKEKYLGILMYSTEF